MRALFVVLVAVFSTIPAWALTQAETLLDVRATFMREVGGVVVDESYQKDLVHQAEDLVHKNQARFGSSQFFLLVDRDHAIQKAFLAFYDAAGKNVLLIGADNVSTGDPKRRGHFETPVGVFENNPSNMSYRALGTKNKVGWRGFGSKGSRVWDLGWQRTIRGRGEPMDIRMLIHATDPDFGESRLGTVQSKGCIRISARFNRFLDRYGILDRAYEENMKARYVLSSARNTIPFAGQFVVVIDSGKSQPASAEAGFHITKAPA